MLRVMAELNLTRNVISRLDAWVNELARPLLPLQAIRESDGGMRVAFTNASPHALMVGKLVRAVSGIRAALLLVDSGFVAESAALLRMVSDFCSEVNAVAEGVHSGKPSAAVKQFVQQYFVPRARTPEEYEAAEKGFYISREELL